MVQHEKSDLKFGLSKCHQWFGGNGVEETERGETSSIIERQRKINIFSALLGLLGKGVRRALAQTEQPRQAGPHQPTGHSTETDTPVLLKNTSQGTEGNTTTAGQQVTSNKQGKRNTRQEKNKVKATHVQHGIHRFWFILYYLIFLYY